MMRKSFVGLSVVLVCALIGVAENRAQAPAGSAGDEQAIRKVIQQYESAWGTDAKAFSALFATDGDSLSSAGTYGKGPAEIQKNAAKTWAEFYKGARERVGIERVRILAPTVALVDATFEITNISGGGTRKGRTTFIFTKSGEQWKIAASRSMIPVPAGAHVTS